MARVEVVGPDRGANALGRILLEYTGIRDGVRMGRAMTEKAKANGHSTAWGWLAGVGVGAAHVRFPGYMKAVSYSEGEAGVNSGRRRRAIVGGVALDLATIVASAILPPLSGHFLALEQTILAVPSGIAAEVQNNGRRRPFSGTLPQ